MLYQPVVQVTWPPRRGQVRRDLVVTRRAQSSKCALLLRLVLHFHHGLLGRDAPGCPDDPKEEKSVHRGAGPREMWGDEYTNTKAPAAFLEHPQS